MHRVEVGSGLLGGLPSGEEIDAGNFRGNRLPEHLDGPFGHFPDAGPVLGLLAGNHHARLEDGVFQCNAFPAEGGIDFLQDMEGHLLALADAVLAIDEHLRLDNGDKSLLMADFRVSRQVIGILLDERFRRRRGGNPVDSSPFRESASGFFVFLQARRKRVEPCSILLFRAFKWGEPAVHLYAGDYAFALKGLREQHAVVGLLMQSFLI
ncbi:MAG: hypothetical protein QT04_C0013G0010 [archaeon GW2011_AR11]|nr:MAG: hypothetical protein QT04_C0013G0010 [archaeon GW2011_AR11]